LPELKKLIKKEKDARVRHRLLFIRQLYEEISVDEACERMCISRQTGYGWLNRWNEAGKDGMHDTSGGGRPPRLDNRQKEQLKEILASKDHWLTHEVRALIKNEFAVSYSFRYIRKLLRGFGMYYAKPYTLDYRRPEDAKKILSSRLSEALKDAPADVIVGFLDETSPQTRDNKQRVWSFSKPRKSKNTTQYRANTFGFYPLNGREVVDFKERSKAKHVCEFLKLIRLRNPTKHIIVILDNARSHVARETRAVARSLNMTLVFLPPYSPDLNPIEYIWKSVKKRVSQILNVRSEWSFKEAIRTTFHRLAKQLSFCQYWIRIFQPVLSGLL
jgi:transposase